MSEILIEMSSEDDSRLFKAHVDFVRKTNRSILEYINPAVDLKMMYKTDKVKFFELIDSIIRKYTTGSIVKNPKK